MAGAHREIERKFLVQEPPAELDKSPRTDIRQGYLAITEGGTEVRVRKEGKRRVLTIKEGHGENRGEEEFEISPAQFDALWPLTRGKRIRKIRYEISDGDRMITVDVYRGKLKGLTTVEVEFPDEEISKRFQPPGWLGREVTEDRDYSNQNLARRGMPQEASR